MRLNNYRNKKWQIAPLLGLLFVMMSCGSYQYVGVESDGIYGEPEMRVNPQQREDAVVEMPNENNSDYYQNYFRNKALEYDAMIENSAIFTDVDSYNSDGYVENDSIPAANQNYGGWGQNSNSVTINYIDNGWNNWGWNNWGWNYYGWNDFYYPWNTWNNWGWNNWNWGWNDPFWYSPYYGNFYAGWGFYGYYPYYSNYYRYPYSYRYPYYGYGYRDRYYSRRPSFSATRRGSYASSSYRGSNLTRSSGRRSSATRNYSSVTSKYNTARRSSSSIINQPYRTNPSVERRSSGTATRNYTSRYNSNGNSVVR